MNNSQEIVIVRDRDFSGLKFDLETDSPFCDNLGTLTEYYTQGLLYVLRSGDLIKGYFALDKDVLSINIVILEVFEPYRDQGLGSQMLDFIKSLMGPDRYFISLSALTSSLGYWKKHGFQSYGQACYLFYPRTRQIQPNCTVTIRHRHGTLPSEKCSKSPSQWITPAFEDEVGNLVFENDYLEYHPPDDVVDILINDDVYYHGRIKYLAKTLLEVNVKEWDHPGSTGFLAAGHSIFICQRIHRGKSSLHLWQKKYGYSSN